MNKAKDIYYFQMQRERNVLVRMSCERDARDKRTMAAVLLTEQERQKTGVDLLFLY